MKLMLYWLLSFTLLSNHLDASCFNIFNRFKIRKAVTSNILSENEDRFMQRLNKIEESASWLRRLRKNKSPAIHSKMQDELVKLDAYLFVGDYATAHRELRPLFREVEFSALAIKALDQQLNQIRSLNVRSLEQAKTVLASKDIATRFWLDEALAKADTLDNVIDELTYIRATFESKVGKKFQEYLLAKEHLESLLEPDACSANCADNVQRLLNSLGIKYDSDRVRFKSFLEIGDDLTNDSLRELIDTHRVAVINRLKRERNAELFAVFKEFATQPALVEKIVSVLSGIPGMHKLKLVRVFNFFLDAVAQTKHAPIINQVVRSQDSAASKLDAILTHNGIFKGNEFLISFARRNDLDSKRTWNEILSYASNSSPQAAEDMLKADQLARSRGPLQLLNEKSVLPRWLVLASSMGGLGYFWFSQSSLEIQSIEVPEVIPSSDGIPREDDYIDDLDEVVDELQNPEIINEIIPENERSPDSLIEIGLWESVCNSLRNFFKIKY